MFTAYQMSSVNLPSHCVACTLCLVNRYALHCQRRSKDEHFLHPGECKGFCISCLWLVHCCNQLATDVHCHVPFMRCWADGTCHNMLYVQWRCFIGVYGRAVCKRLSEPAGGDCSMTKVGESLSSTVHAVTLMLIWVCRSRDGVFEYSKLHLALGKWWIPDIIYMSVLTIKAVSCLKDVSAGVIRKVSDDTDAFML